ncbi:hypothetical protein JCM10212_001753, partial [Sporobolomyces blumeae]
MAPSYKPFMSVQPLTSCTDAYLVFGQGQAPYTISVIPTQSNGTFQPLETLPRQNKAGVFKWNVDFQPGANI